MKIAVVGGHGTGRTSLKQALAKKLPANYVLTDTQALIDAIRSDPLVLTNRLPPDVLARQREVDLTLLMGLDLARTPPDQHTRHGLSSEAVDTRLRDVLDAYGFNYVVIYGNGDARTESAMQAIAHHAGQAVVSTPYKDAPWQWNCEKCSDGSCEHRIFTGLIK